MTAGGSSSSLAFEQYTADVYNWAYRLLGRHHDALDVVQDVFIRWDAQCARQTPKQPRGWLRRVTLNRAIDLHRRTRSAPPPADDALRLMAVKDKPAASLDREMLRHDIAAALDNLSDVQRSVLVAKIFDELTFARIADELGLAPSTVKTHYLRAVRGVRDRLGPRWAVEETL